MANSNEQLAEFMAAEGFSDDTQTAFSLAVEHSPILSSEQVLTVLHIAKVAFHEVWVAQDAIMADQFKVDL